MKSHIIPIRMAAFKTHTHTPQKIESTGEEIGCAEKLELLMGMSNDSAAVENSIGIPQKYKNIIIKFLSFTLKAICCC